MASYTNILTLLNPIDINYTVNLLISIRIRFYQIDNTIFLNTSSQHETQEISSHLTGENILFILVFIHINSGSFVNSNISTNIDLPLIKNIINPRYNYGRSAF